MNLDKKRKRQSGRQAKQVQDSYSIYIDNEGWIHSKFVRARKRPVDQDLVVPK